MSNILSSLLNAAADAVESGAVTDMSVVKKGGGGGGKLWPKGTVLARLVSVVEIGNRAVSFQGQAKDPAPHVTLSFAIMTNKPEYQYDDGKPGIISTFDMTLSQSAKAKTSLLFQRMNYMKTAKNFAELLGQPYMFTITHNEPKEGQKVRANIDLTTVAAPMNPVSGDMYEFPQAPDEYFKLFLWQKPTKAMWDSLFITDEKNEDGSSRNWMQDKLMQALDFEGSALQRLLFGDAIPRIPAAQPETPAAPAAAPSVAAAPAVPASIPAAPVQAQPAPVPQAAPAIPVAPTVPQVPQL